MSKVHPTAIELAEVDRLVSIAGQSEHVNRDMLDEVVRIRGSNHDNGYTKDLETAIETILPEGTDIAEVLSDPAKWKVEKKKED